MVMMVLVLISSDKCFKAVIPLSGHLSKITIVSFMQGLDAPLKSWKALNCF